MKKILFATLILISSLLVLVSCNDVVPVPDTSNETPLTLEFPNDGMKINATITFENDNGKLYYKKNGETSFHEVTDSRIENIKAGDTIALFADRTSVEGDKYLRIQCSEDCFVYGNVMSLIRKDNFAEAKEVFKDAFRELFRNNKNMKNHYSKPIVLPATKLAKNCYQEMFSGCIALSDLSTMRIAADTMVDYACYRMFFSCTGLHKAPVLPATTVAESCYEGMFYNCSRLSWVEPLTATTMATNCYMEMFRDCKTLGIGPELPATVLADGCYAGMFRDCSKLTRLRGTSLPVDRLPKDSCHYMFFGCKSLTTAPEIKATSVAASSCERMFEGCESLVNVQDELPATT